MAGYKQSHEQWKHQCKLDFCMCLYYMVDQFIHPMALKRI